MKKERNLIFLPIYIFVGVEFVFMGLLIGLELGLNLDSKVFNTLWQCMSVCATVFGLLVATLTYKIQKKDFNKNDSFNSCHELKIKTIDYFASIREVENKIFLCWNEYNSTLKLQANAKDDEIINDLILIDRKIILNLIDSRSKSVKFKEFINSNELKLNHNLNQFKVEINYKIDEINKRINEHMIEIENLEKTNSLKDGINNISYNIDDYLSEKLEEEMLAEIDEQMKKYCKN